MQILSLLTSAAVAFLLDQTTKRAVQTRLAGLIGARWRHIREVHHAKRLYGHAIFRAVLIFIWCFAGFAAVWLRSSGQWLQGPWAMLGMGCALGGAAGNLFDILRRQHVVDFIDLGWWPVFNLADVAIVGGLLLAFVSSVAHV